MFFGVFVKTTLFAVHTAFRVFISIFESAVYRFFNYVFIGFLFAHYQTPLFWLFHNPPFKYIVIMTRIPVDFFKHTHRQPFFFIIPVVSPASDYAFRSIVPDHDSRGFIKNHIFNVWDLCKSYVLQHILGPINAPREGRRPSPKLSCAKTRLFDQFGKPIITFTLLPIK